MNNRPQGVTTAWYFVAVTFDAGSGKVEIHQDPLNTFTFDPTRVGHRADDDDPDAGDQRRAAADCRRLGAAGPGPRALQRQDRQPAALPARRSAGRPSPTLKQGQPGPPTARRLGLLGRHRDRNASPTPARSACTARTVNLPMRAVTGHNWDSFEMDYKQARPQYGAIYFHDDDIDDARWEVGFEFRVPDTLKSGDVRGAAARGSFEDYVPFMVRPKKGQPTSARIALLIPTFSYLAYAGTGTSAFRPLSLYSRHSDGSGVCYSSRLRPITNMRPKIQTNNPWQFMADTHLVDWLEVKGFDVDFLTDEDLHFEGAAAARALQGRDDGHAPRVLLDRDAQRAAHLPERRRPADVPGRQRLLLGDADGSDRPLHRGAAARRHRALAGRAGRALPQPHRRARRPVAIPWHGAAAVLRRRLHGPGLRSQPAVHAACPAASIRAPR